MRLHDLLASLPGCHVPAENVPAENPEVTGIQHDSRLIEPGDLFVAIAGELFDGGSFAVEAAGRGAAAVLGYGPPPAGLTVPWVQADEPRGLLGPISARLYDHPDERLILVGITGTNGKSTVANLVRNMLEAGGIPAGVLGTLGCYFGEISYGPARTTREACEVFRILEEMCTEGARAAVMEVSSHALALGRVAGLRYDVAAFTNLTRDHLDFHGDLEDYFDAKRGLFSQLKPGGRSVVYAGDAWGRRLAAELAAPLTFGTGGDVAVQEAELDLVGTRGSLSTPRGEVRFESRLIGRYNLENTVAAFAVAEALELPADSSSASLAGQPPLPGRLEPVEAGQPFPVLIDFAHTPGALEALLRSVGELTDRQVALVFGCGGGKDQGKRPIMGRIAGELADLPVVTSDNPRNEDPQAIMSQVEEGLRTSGNKSYRMVPDRREAIRRAISIACSGGEWAVVVAGKGHEAFQLVAGERLPFSDRQELETALAEACGPADEGSSHHVEERGG